MVTDGSKIVRTHRPVGDGGVCAADETGLGRASMPTSLLLDNLEHLCFTLYDEV